MRSLLLCGAALLAAAVPVAMAVWSPEPYRIGGFALPAPAVVSAGASAAGGVRVPWLAALYGSTVAFFLLRLLARWWRLRRLTPATIAVPMTFGLWRPRILMPLRFEEAATPLARRAALAHERVHVRRKDYAFQLLIELSALPVALHPAMHAFKRRVTAAVEMRCDELAAREFDTPREYTQGLLEAARVLLAPAAPGGRSPASR